jgi:hypothetical protein
MKLHDVVALLIDLPQHNLRRGQVGTIVEEWQPGMYEVEFVDADGCTYAMAAVSSEFLITLHYQPEGAQRSA